VTTANEEVIRFDRATIHYRDRVALDDITLGIRSGEFIGIIGPNGSGKTTLLKAILGLVPPVSGSVRVFDCACERLRCEHRARIGYLPQKDLVDPHFPITVAEAVMMGRYSSIGLFRYPGKADRAIVSEALTAVNMVSEAGTPLGELSGGQQQRVMIARALAQRPEVLLLDEPTTGIDTPTQHAIMELIVRLHRDLRLTILFVTHDINLISRVADRLVLLNTRLFAVGPPSDVLTRGTLAQVYGKDIVVTDHGAAPYVIVGDHHA
jgi:ABC-type Mn2+/Zn2+ transport system ATPase subunit